MKRRSFLKVLGVTPAAGLIKGKERVKERVVEVKKPVEYWGSAMPHPVYLDLEFSFSDISSVKWDFDSHK